MIAVVDNQNDQVTIAKILPYMPPKDPYHGKTPKEVEQIKQIMRNSVVVVDNAAVFRKWDMHFQEVDHLDEAVKAYYTLDRAKILTLSNEIKQAYNPDNIIEVRKTDLKGRVYEINPDEVSNGAVAVMIVCWAALKARGTAKMLDEGNEPTQQDYDDFSVPFSI
jgi:hypothetical protein